MRIHLLEAIEAEKNAVLAITDEASEGFAAEARQAADGEKAAGRKSNPSSHPGRASRETEMINEFNSCWAHDDRTHELIAISPSKTPISRLKRSPLECAQELERFEKLSTADIQIQTQTAARSNASCSRMRYHGEP